MEALDVHLSDQTDEADANEARHLARLYRYLRREGCPRFLAGVLTAVHAAGDAWSSAWDSEGDPDCPT